MRAQPLGLTAPGMLVCPGRVQQEIDEVIGQVRRPEMADQARMHFTMAVVHEVQRFADIIPLGLPHMTSRDTEVQGFRIPKVSLWPSSPSPIPSAVCCPNLATARWGQGWTPSPPSSFPQALAVPAWEGVGLSAEAGPVLSIQSPQSGGEDKLRCAKACGSLCTHLAAMGKKGAGTRVYQAVCV